MKQLLFILLFLILPLNLFAANAPFDIQTPPLVLKSGAKSWSLPFALRGPSANFSSVYIPVCEPSASAFRRDLFFNYSWSSSGDTLAIIGNSGEIYFTSDSTGYKKGGAEIRKPRGYIKDPSSGTVFVPLEELLDAFGAVVGSFSENSHTCSFNSSVTKIIADDSQGQFRVTYRTSMAVNPKTIIDKGYAEIVFPDTVPSDFTVRSGDLFEISSKMEPDSAGNLRVCVNFPGNWIGRVYSAPSSSDTIVEFMPDFPLKSSYRSESVRSIETSDNVLNISASGPFQYFWVIDPANKYMTVELPMLSLPEEKLDMAKLSSFSPGIKISEMNRSYGVVRIKIPFSGESVPVVFTTGKNPYLLSVKYGPPSMAEATGSGVTAPPENKAIVVIDPGHGGCDAGACNRSLGISEKYINMELSLALAKYLESYGWKVIFTRKTDRDVSWAYSPDKVELQARADIANLNNASIFLSVHCNASTSSSVNGFSVYWTKDIDHELAKYFDCDFLSPELDLNHRGIIRSGYYVLRNTGMPAVIIETAFISNMSDAQKLSKPSFRDAVMKDIAKIINKYLSENCK